MARPDLTPAEWRKDAGLSQAAIAAQVGLTGKNPSRTWQKWESGQTEPPLAVMLKFQQISGGEVTLEGWAKVRREHLASVAKGRPRRSRGRPRMVSAERGAA
jgi:transcriptional regulator with XRE-family HTH domain